MIFYVIHKTLFSTATQDSISPNVDNHTLGQAHSFYAVQLARFGVDISIDMVEVCTEQEWLCSHFHPSVLPTALHRLMTIIHFTTGGNFYMRWISTSGFLLSTCWTLMIIVRYRVCIYSFSSYSVSFRSNVESQLFSSQSRFHASVLFLRITTFALSFRQGNPSRCKCRWSRFIM